MRALVLLLVSAWISNTNAYSTSASKTVINEAIELCKEYALEDGVKKEELETYLLECVNEELESRGFQKIESID